MGGLMRRLAGVVSFSGLCLVVAAGTAGATIGMPGVGADLGFDDNAFADDVIAAGGTFWNEAGDAVTDPADIAASITGANLGTFIAPSDGEQPADGPWVQVVFTDNWVVNTDDDGGVDLVLFARTNVANEQFTVLRVEVDVNSVVNTYNLALTNQAGIAIAQIDLADFGVPYSLPEYPADNFVIGFRLLQDGGTTSYPVLAAVGALHSADKSELTGYPGAVPEPATLLLLGTGFAGLARWRRSRRDRP